MLDIVMKPALQRRNPEQVRSESVKYTGIDYVNNDGLVETF
jgi:hypothetical protein